MKFEAGMIRIQAEERLAAGCDARDVYDLVLAATGGDHEAAATALSQRIEAELKAGNTPDVGPR